MCGGGEPKKEAKAEEKPPEEPPPPAEPPPAEKAPEEKAPEKAPEEKKSLVAKDKGSKIAAKSMAPPASIALTSKRAAPGGGPAFGGPKVKDAKVTESPSLALMSVAKKKS